MMERSLRTPISHFSQDPRMHVIEPLRLVSVQFHQVVLNLLFSYTGRDFALPALTYTFGDSRDVGSLIGSED